MERGFVQTFIDYMSLLVPAKGEAYLMLASGGCRKRTGLGARRY